MDEGFSVHDIANICFGYGGHGVIVGIKAHFDCSGQNDSKVLTVGGYLAWDGVCEQIENDWKATLIGEGYCESDGKPGVFHLADFGTESCRYGTANWDIQTKRVPFIKRLATLVNRKSNHIISISIENSRYKEFIEGCPHREIWGPDFFSGCALMALVFIETMLDKAKLSEQSVAYVFESGDRQRELNEAFMEYVKHPHHLLLRDLRSLTFSPKKLPLLQGADLTAGKVNEVVERALEKLGFLDNGTRWTPVRNFEKYYSLDGTSIALLRDEAFHNCYVANKLAFEEADKLLMPIISKNPKILERRLHRKLPKL